MMRTAALALLVGAATARNESRAKHFAARAASRDEKTFNTTC